MGVVTETAPEVIYPTRPRSRRQSAGPAIGTQYLHMQPCARGQWPPEVRLFAANGQRSPGAARRAPVRTGHVHNAVERASGLQQDGLLTVLYQDVAQVHDFDETIDPSEYGTNRRTCRVAQQSCGMGGIETLDSQPIMFRVEGRH